MRGAGSKLFCTVFTCKRWTALTGVTIDSIYATAVVLTWPRGTLIYIDLTVQTSVTGFALTSVSVVMVHTGATVLTGLTLALVFF